MTLRQEPKQPPLPVQIVTAPEPTKRRRLGVVVAEPPLVPRLPAVRTTATPLLQRWQIVPPTIVRPDTPQRMLTEPENNPVARVDGAGCGRKKP